VPKFTWSDKKQIDYLEKGPLRHLHRRRMNFINRHLENLLPAFPDATCMDLGCGDGLFLKDFFSKGRMELIGCDADLVRLLRAREFSRNTPLVCAFADKAPFRSNVFDILILHHVLEHIEDDNKAMRECRRLLKKGGILILGVPNEDSPNGRLSRFLHPKLYRTGEHVNFYSEDKILNLLKSLNFKVLEIGRIGFLFPLYYLHILLISNKFTFLLGDHLTQVLKRCADSLIIICESPGQQEDRQL